MDIGQLIHSLQRDADRAEDHARQHAKTADEYRAKAEALLIDATDTRDIIERLTALARRKDRPL